MLLFPRSREASEAWDSQPFGSGTDWTWGAQERLGNQLGLEVLRYFLKNWNIYIYLYIFILYIYVYILYIYIYIYIYIWILGCELQKDADLLLGGGALLSRGMGPWAGPELLAQCIVRSSWL